MNSFALSNKYIMSPAGLAESDLDLIMGSISSHNIDYADLYFQYSKNEFWALEDGAVKNGSFSIDQGVGMRAIAGQKTAFTYSDEISLQALNNGVKIVKSINKNNCDSCIHDYGGKIEIKSLIKFLKYIVSNRISMPLYRIKLKIGL